MAKRDIKTLEGAYAAFGKGDVDSVLAVMDSRISWSEPDTLPWGGRVSGSKGVAKVFAEALRLIPDLKVKVESYDSAGDVVVARGTFSGTGKKGGKFKAPFAHVWTMRDGKAVRMQNYTDTAAINAAIGGSGRRGVPRGGP
jgi:uncharacterized protein